MGSRATDGVFPPARGDGGGDGAREPLRGVTGGELARSPPRGVVSCEADALPRGVVMPTRSSSNSISRGRAAAACWSLEMRRASDAAACFASRWNSRRLRILVGQGGARLERSCVKVIPFRVPSEMKQPRRQVARLGRDRALQCATCYAECYDTTGHRPQPRSATVLTECSLQLSFEVQVGVIERVAVDGAAQARRREGR